MISIWINYTKLSRVTSYNVYKLDGNFSATFLYVTMSCQAKLGLEKKNPYQWFYCASVFCRTCSPTVMLQPKVGVFLFLCLLGTETHQLIQVNVPFSPINFSSVIFGTFSVAICKKQFTEWSSILLLIILKAANRFKRNWTTCIWKSPKTTVVWHIPKKSQSG